MGRVVMVLVVALIGANEVSAQYWPPPVSWRTANRSPSFEVAYDVQSTSDYGFVVAGERDGHFFVMKTDRDGDTTWTRTFLNSIGGARQVQAIQGGYAICGTARDSANVSRLCLAKLDFDGEIQWVHYYPASENPNVPTLGNSVIRCQNGDLAAAGAYLRPNGFHDFFVVRTDGTGNRIWDTLFNQSYSDRAYEITEGSDGSLCVVGTDGSWGATAKLSPEGELMWITPLGQLAHDVVALDDGYFMTIGYYASSGDVDMLLAEFAPYGGVFRSQLISPESGDGIDERGYSLAVGPEASLIAAGYRQTDGHVIYCLNDSMQVNWSLPMNVPVYYNTSAYNWERFAAVERTFDSAIILAGTTVSATGDPDIYLVKLCPGGASAAHPEYLRSTSSSLALRLAPESGVVTDFLVTEIPFGATGSVSGNAGLTWSVMPNGDGNDGDSIIFVASQPLAGALDTFWINGLSGQCHLSWTSGCRRDTTQMLHSGSAEVIGGQGDSLVALRLRHHIGELDRLIITAVAPGSHGLVSGQAAQSWNALPNGDGNDGDSVIFETSEPLATGALDTFWVLRPDSRCHVSWSVGCAQDTVNLFWGEIDSVRLYQSHWSMPLHLWTWGEQDLDSVEIWIRHESGDVELYADAPAVNEPGAHEYLFEVEFEPYAVFYPAITDRADCPRVFPQEYVQMPWTTAGDPGELAESYSLQAYPNPFNGMAVVSITLPRTRQTDCIVFDLLGRHVATLYDGMLEPGEHKFTFDGSNLPSGIYFARVQAGEFVKTQKLLLLK